MIEIKLSQQGKHKGQFVAYVDDKYSDLAKLRWCVLIDKTCRTQYASRTESGKTTYLHTLVLELKLGRPIAEGMECDHIDGNGLNNLEENLREATKSQNQWNKRKQKNGESSQYKGVSWERSRSKWRAEINVEGKPKFLGRFSTEQLAYEAYCKAADKYHQEFANKN